MQFTFNRKAISWFSIALIIGLFLPHNNISFQIIHAFLPLILYLIYFPLYKKTNQIFPPVIFLVTTFIISFCINALIDTKIETKAILRLLNLIFLFLLFPFVSDVKTKNSLLYFALIFIFMSQIAYVYNIGPLVHFFDAHFPYDGDRAGFTSEYLLQSAGDIDSILSRRYGGLYHNPNQAVRYVSLLLALFFLENKQGSFMKIIPFITIVFASFFFSGSRSGFLVGTFLFGGYYIYLKNLKAKGFIYVVGILIVALYILTNLLGTQEIRFFQIEKGFESSLGAKLIWFLSFLKQLSSPVYCFFGHFSTNNLTELYNVPLLDSEWGELFYSFGLLGFLALMFFYRFIFSKNDKNLRYYLIILFWAVSSTIIFSFRMSFVFMLCLSKYYSDYLARKDK